LVFVFITKGKENERVVFFLFFEQTITIHHT